MNNSENKGIKIVASNKKAQFDYFKVKAYEVGVVLTGKEVKSIREGKWSLKGSYATVVNGEVWLLGSKIPAYKPNKFTRDCDESRNIKLLLNKSEIRDIAGYIGDKGITLVVTKAYLKNRRVKCELWVASGKHKYDKRQSIAKRESDRRAQEALKSRGKYIE